MLKDTKGILIQQTENIQSARQIRFTSVKEIVTLKDTIKDYTFKACEVEDLSWKVELKKAMDYEIPEEFQSKLDENSALKNGFIAFDKHIFKLGDDEQTDIMMKLKLKNE